MADWVTPQFWLSLALAAMGCTGLLLAGRGKWYGWAIGFLAQPVWAVYAIVSGGYGLILTSVLYAVVYWQNLMKWRKEVQQMSLTKHGRGEIIPEDDDLTKQSAKGWSKDDQEALAEENADADGGPKS